MSKPSCPYCVDSHVIKNGFVTKKNQFFDEVQRTQAFLCKDCNSSFQRGAEKNDQNTNRQLQEFVQEILHTKARKYLSTRVNGKVGVAPLDLLIEYRPLELGKGILVLETTAIRQSQLRQSGQRIVSLFKRFDEEQSFILKLVIACLVYGDFRKAYATRTYSLVFTKA